MDINTNIRQLPIHAIYPAPSMLVDGAWARVTNKIKWTINKTNNNNNSFFEEVTLQYQFLLSLFILQTRALQYGFCHGDPPVF